MEASTIKAAVLQEALAHGLAVVSRAVASRSTLSVLSNVLLDVQQDSIILAATNLEIGIRTRIPAKVDQAGAVTLPSKLLGDLVASFPPERVDLALAEASQTMNLRCGRVESNIKGIAAEEFPVVPYYAGGGFSLPADQLRLMIDQVQFAAAKDEARPILTGCLLRLEEDKITLVAADGFRLSHRCQNGLANLKPGDVIIPARSLAELSRIIKDAETVEVLLQAERRQIVFRAGDVVLVSQVIEGNFPDFTQIIPKSYTTRTVVDRAGLLKAVQVSSLFARDAANIVKFEIRPAGDELQNGKVSLLATSAELGDNVADLEASIDGDGLDIAFNTVYLREALAATDQPTVALETSGASSPGIIRAVGDDNWLHVIMPMHISK